LSKLFKKLIGSKNNDIIGSYKSIFFWTKKIMSFLLGKNKRENIISFENNKQKKSNSTINLLQEKKSNIIDLFEDKEFTDLKILTSDSKINPKYTIYAHKCVIGLNCKILREKIKNTNEIFLNEDFETILTLIQVRNTIIISFKYLYNYSIEINEENMEKLLKLSEYLELINLKNACYKTMLEGMGIKKIQLIFENCLRNEYEFDSSELLQKCLSYFEINFSEITTEDFFFDIPKDLLKIIISSDNLNIDEDLLFVNILEWGKEIF
jgi:hypothetical protein